MSVKSTQEIDRTEAEQLYVRLKKEDLRIDRTLRAEATMMTNKELENELERMDDEQCNGESFRNYYIK